MSKPRRVLFLGSKRAGVTYLEALSSTDPTTLCGVVTVDDTGDGRSALSLYQQFAAEQSVPLRTARSSAEVAAAANELKADVCLVSGWYGLLPPSVLASVPLGFVGIHNSLLPAYRGFAPLVWALINGEPEAGVSLFRLSDGMDEGAVWAQATVPIGPEDDIASLEGAVVRAAANLIGEHWPAIATGALEARAQALNGASYGARRSASDGLIDWSWNAGRVHNWIRAQTHPYPGAFTFMGDTRLRVWSSRANEDPYFGSPGQVVAMSGSEALVACGEGTALWLRSFDMESDREPRTAAQLRWNARLGHTSPSSAHG